MACIEEKASRRRKGIAMIQTVLSFATSSQCIMNQPLVDQKQCLERHRPYLMFLARGHLSRHHPVRLDSSDIVQQTLLDAFSKREVIVLHHLQGLKLAQVATEIDRTEASVAGRLFRGLRSFHALLAE